MVRFLYLILLLMSLGCRGNDNDVTGYAVPDRPQTAFLVSHGRVYSDTLFLEVNFSYTTVNDSVTEWIDGAVRLPLSLSREVMLHYNENGAVPHKQSGVDDEKPHISFDLDIRPM